MNEKLIFMKKSIEDKKQLEENFKKNQLELIVCENTDELLDILSKKYEEIDLLVIDMEEDTLLGLESIKVVKKINDYNHIPIVIIANKRDVMKGLTVGAQEYIIPPYNDEELCSFIKIILQNKKDDMNLYAPEASVDMSFKQYFNSEIKRAERGGYELAILILTVVSKDYNQYSQEKNVFNLINQLGNMVKDNLRTTDTIVRYNRSNIITFLPYTSKFNAEIVYEKILEVFNKKIISGTANNDFEIVYSIASYPYDGETVEDLLFNAERYLEDNKSSILIQ